MKLKNYSMPTPKKLKRFGDALLGVSTTITGFSLYNDMKEVAIIALIIGSVGKFITNFFAPEEES